MSGFNDDIVSILKHTNMYKGTALGFISGSSTNERMADLQLHLMRLGCIVSGTDRGSITWDYIVIPNEFVSARTVLLALSSINAGGIIILEISEAQRKYEKYLRIGTNQSATKVQYEDRYYLIIHTGEDYGEL